MYDFTSDGVQKTKPQEELEEQAADLHYVFTGNELYEEIADHPRFLAIQEKMGLPPMLSQ